MPRARKERIYHERMWNNNGLPIDITYQSRNNDSMNDEYITENQQILREDREEDIEHDFDSSNSVANRTFESHEEAVRETCRILLPLNLSQSALKKVVEAAALISQYKITADQLKTRYGSPRTFGLGSASSSSSIFDRSRLKVATPKRAIPADMDYMQDIQPDSPVVRQAAGSRGPTQFIRVPNGNNPQSHQQPPHRYIIRNPQNPKQFEEQFDGYLLRDDRPRFSRAEVTFLRSINVEKPLLESVSAAITDSMIDLGKIGLTLYKYEEHGRVDSITYQATVNALAKFGLDTMKRVTRLPTGICPDAFQLAQSLMINVASAKYAPLLKKELAKSAYFVEPSFRNTVRRFTGSFPFQTEKMVSTSGIGAIPSDPSRAVTKLVKYIMAQLFLDPIGHQSYAHRSIYSTNCKSAHTDLPRNVVNFIIDFTLFCFGYHPSLRSPTFTYHNLCETDSGLAAALGSDTARAMLNFQRLQNDVDRFQGVINDKIQRLLSDLRRYRIQHIVEMIDGKEAVFSSFVCNPTDVPFVEPLTDGNEQDEMMSKDEKPYAKRRDGSNTNERPPAKRIYSAIDY